MAAIRMLLSWLTEKGILAMNPAREVKTPRFSRIEGKTPAPPHEEVQKLLDSIDVSHVVGLRDRALLAVMAYTFARIGAVVSLTPQDYFQVGKRSLIRFREKGQGERNSSPSQTGGIPRCLSQSRQAFGRANKTPFPVHAGVIAQARGRWTLTHRRLGDAQAAPARCGTFHHLFQPLFSCRRYHQSLRKQWHSGGGPADSGSC